MAVQVLTDSTSYISKEIKEELNIRMVSLSLSFGSDSIREVDIDNDLFYKKWLLMEFRHLHSLLLASYIMKCLR